ncbi:MAG: WbuC family cupin fold metalloprotein [Proteobacteria bacterium]|nr:WbuC family cupin fold metalloprotein [Pseudomonadota bacterium]MBU1687338.1 WbuC family cupin fold metalloprotein [Pseudomonadota bacterium]
MREAAGALFNDQSLLEVGPELLAMVKERAQLSMNGRFRLCLHHDPGDAIQQMMIACTPRSYSAPHRHPGRVLSYQMVEGRLAVVLFDDAGGISRRIHLGGDGSFCLWLGASQWYMPLAETDVSVFCEVLQGPNARGEAAEWAPWAPAEGSAEASAYLADLRLQVFGERGTP